MDKRAFKQRMQNLKSYRENNPGKGYWDWKVETFADGGEVGDPEKERFYQATGRSSSGRPLEEGLKPVFSLEDAANMTPIGDAISAKDAYDAVKNRDWLGAGLAAVTMIPFVPTTVRNFRKKYKGVTPKREIPTVNKKAIDNAIDEAKNYRDSRIKLYQQAIEDRNASYERLIENEDALRRAVNFDKKYGTNYVKTYTKQLQNYAKSKNSPDLMQIGIKPMGANGSFDPNIPDYVFINSDNDNMKKLFNTYKSKRQFVKDFNSVPITSIGDNKTLV